MDKFRDILLFATLVVLLIIAATGVTVIYNRGPKVSDASGVYTMDTAHDIRDVRLFKAATTNAYKVVKPKQVLSLEVVFVEPVTTTLDVKVQRGKYYTYQRATQSVESAQGIVLSPEGLYIGPDDRLIVETGTNVSSFVLTEIGE